MRASARGEPVIGWLERLATEDRLLAIIGISTLVLLGIAFIFAVLTIALRLRSLRREIVRTRLEQRWEPLILSALTGEVDTAQVHAAVPRAHALFFVAYLLRFVNRFVGEERLVLRELARPYLPRVAAQLRSPRDEARARGVQTLVLLGLDEYEADVVAALDDPSLTVAMVAARALASKEHPEYAAEILRRIHRFEHWNPLYLASLFSSMGSVVVPALRSIYADAKADTVVRRVAADALHDLDDIGSADTAYSIVSAEQDTELIAASLHLLARAGRPEHAERGARRARARESADQAARRRGARRAGRTARPAASARCRRRSVAVGRTVGGARPGPLGRHGHSRVARVRGRAARYARA
jgi:hypothetical protein